MHSRVTAKLSPKETVLGAFSPSESLTVDGAELKDFTLTGNTQKAVRDDLGAGRQTTLTGNSGNVRKTVIVTLYDRFPQVAFFKVQYTNTGTAAMKVAAWANNRYSISAAPGAAEPAFWSYESGSYQKRPDWVMPLKVGFK